MFPGQRIRPPPHPLPHTAMMQPRQDRRVQREFPPRRIHPSRLPVPSNRAESGDQLCRRHPERALKAPSLPLLVPALTHRDSGAPLEGRNGLEKTETSHFMFFVPLHFLPPHTVYG